MYRLGLNDSKFRTKQSDWNESFAVSCIVTWNPDKWDSKIQLEFLKFRYMLLYIISVLMLINI